MTGFLAGNQLDLWPNSAADMTTWVADGMVQSRETVNVGFGSARDAFIGLFSCKNVGKMLVKLYV